MDIEEIVKELNTLPKGYISHKKIKGKNYNYLQFSEGDSLKSVYLRDSELDYYTAAIGRRKALENELKSQLDAGKATPTISQRARSLTGSLMSEDDELARFENGVMLMCDERRAPLMLLRIGSIAGFLASRSIDSSRSNSRLLKKVMDIHGEPDETVSLYSHGATITDNYWFKAKGSKLKYNDIKFENDAYSEVALDGKVLVYNRKPRLSPQLTLGGSYEKCWKLIDGKWWLYKRGSEAELYSELISSETAKLLGIDTAEYEIERGYIRTENFAEIYNYEPIMAIAGDDDRPEIVLDAIKSLSYKAEYIISDVQIDRLCKDYFKLLIFDAVVKNEDRHNENLGIMRNRYDGRIVGLAPNFDNNISLIARSEIINMDPAKDGLIKYLLKFLRNAPDAALICRELFSSELPDSLGEGTVIKMLTDCDDNIAASRDNAAVMCENIERKKLAEFISRRYNYIKNKTEKIN